MNKVNAKTTSSLPSIKDIVRAQYPKLHELPFCHALENGRFGRTEILRSEIVELYRALDTRGKIQAIYKEKLRAAQSQGVISPKEVKSIEEIIDDEGETEDHIDHLDMRFKLFVGTPISRQSRLRHDPELQAINDEWMSVCHDASLFELMALTAAIEDWYAPVSAFFEDQYRRRGFSDEELELFIVHKGADIDHSEAQFDVLEKSRDHFDGNNLVAILTRTFNTSRGYDTAKFRLAESNCALSDLIE
jgi:hypothetical protein